jgi:hypothetical protein
MPASMGCMSPKGTSLNTIHQVTQCCGAASYWFRSRSDFLFWCRSGSGSETSASLYCFIFLVSVIYCHNSQYLHSILKFFAQNYLVELHFPLKWTRIREHGNGSGSTGPGWGFGSDKMMPIWADLRIRIRIHINELPFTVFLTSKVKNENK